MYNATSLRYWLSETVQCPQWTSLLQTEL